MTRHDESCPGCGLAGSGVEGARHPYIGASAACWACYGELLAGGFGGHVSVDTYAVQHPGVEERRSIQSVAVHLISLCALLERDASPSAAPNLIRRALAKPRGWRWLPIGQPIGTITVAHVVEGHSDAPAWATDVWHAWSGFHDEVRAWLDDMWD